MSLTKSCKSQLVEMLKTVSGDCSSLERVRASQADFCEGKFSDLSELPEKVRQTRAAIQAKK